MVYTVHIKWNGNLYFVQFDSSLYRVGRDWKMISIHLYIDELAKYTFELNEIFVKKMCALASHSRWINFISIPFFLFYHFLFFSRSLMYSVRILQRQFKQYDNFIFVLFAYTFFPFAMTPSPFLLQLCYVFIFICFSCLNSRYIRFICWTLMTIQKNWNKNNANKNGHILRWKKKYEWYRRVPADLKQKKTRTHAPRFIR